MGGLVVRSSLTACGFDLDTPHVQLTETRPRWGRRNTVLAQNLWNVLPARDFAEASRPYERRSRALMLARRLTANVVLSRANHVVTMSETMATAVSDRIGRPVEARTVSLPLVHTTYSTVDRLPGLDRTIIVPGAVTWYKRPQRALHVAELLRDRGVMTPRLLFAGARTNPDCWAALQQEADQLGLEIHQVQFSQLEMARAMHSAPLTVVPSEVESLGFAFSEALHLAPCVIASGIPAHRELARHVGRLPVWLDDFDGTLRSENPTVLDVDRVRAEWDALGRALGLSRR